MTSIKESSQQVSRNHQASPQGGRALLDDQGITAQHYKHQDRSQGFSKAEESEQRFRQHREQPNMQPRNDEQVVEPRLAEVLDRIGIDSGAVAQQRSLDHGSTTAFDR